MAGEYWSNVFNDWISAPQNGMIYPLLKNAFNKKQDDSDLSDSVAYQEYLNKMSMENAAQVYALQAEADKIAMNFSANEAQKLRDWQAEQSNTAYQRAVADMRKAGINPVLAYAQGGASTPSGASGQGVSSARQAASLNLDNVVGDFKKLIRSLESSERNTKTMADAQKYVANINAAKDLFIKFAPSSTGSIGFLG